MGQSETKWDETKWDRVSPSETKWNQVWLLPSHPLPPPTPNLPIQVQLASSVGVWNCWVRGLRVWDFRHYGFEFPICDFSILVMMLNANKANYNWTGGLGVRGWPIGFQLWFHCDFNLISLRFHFDVTSTLFLGHFDVTSISLRSPFAFTSMPFRIRVDSISIQLRIHFDAHSTTRPRGQAFSNEQIKTKRFPGWVHPTPSDVAFECY